MQKSLSHYTCATKSFSGHVVGGSQVIDNSQNHCNKHKENHTFPEIRQRKHKPCRNAKIVFALHLCSQIVLWSCCWWRSGYRRQQESLKNHRKTTHFPKSDMDNTHLAEMPKSLSHFTCAAKSPFSANANAKRQIAVKRKCL